MNVQLPSEIEQYVQRKMASGQFKDESEVVEEALRCMMLEDDEQQWSPEYCEYVRRELDIGYEDIREGRVAPLDIEQTIAELRKQRRESR
jgi:putative addiction module CopG family antidote